MLSKNVVFPSFIGSRSRSTELTSYTYPDIKLHGLWGDLDSQHLNNLFEDFLRDALTVNGAHAGKSLSIY